MMARSVSLYCWVYGWIYIWYGLVPTVTANDGVNWKTVAVSWVFSLISTLILLAIAAALLMRKRRRKRRKTEEETTPSFRRELSVQSEASDMTRVSIQSNQPLYKRVPVREPSSNRRISDYISIWCSKHKLSEVIAANLRENGFTSREQVDSLRASDVTTLGLPYLAQQVQLRNVLENLQRANQESSVQMTSYDVTDHAPGGRSVPGSNRRRSGSSDASQRQSNTTDESPSVTTPSPKQPSSGPQSGHIHFTYPRSLGQLPEETPISTSVLPNARRHNSSRLSFHGWCPGRSMMTSKTSFAHPESCKDTLNVTVLEAYLQVLTYTSEQVDTITEFLELYFLKNKFDEKLMFSSNDGYGLMMSSLIGKVETAAEYKDSDSILSDSGLYGLAECLGTEWRHLAAILGVPKAQQEHLLHDYPSNTKQQICEMIRYWRELIAKGEKEQVKADLATALTKIKRKDLADEILREQVHGSDPNLRGPQRMNSVV